MKEPDAARECHSVTEICNILAHQLHTVTKPIVIASDLDETLCNTYIFDAQTNTHVPQLRQEMVDVAKKLPIPILIATGRSTSDPTTAFVWGKLSRHPFPIIGENGGVIFYPQSGKKEILCDTRHIQILQDIQKNVPFFIQKLRQEHIAQDEDEIFFDTNRKTSIEVRIQHRETKKGNETTHHEASLLFQELLNINEIIAISSGSSVSIHSPSIDKGHAIEHVLTSLVMPRKDVFLITLGDNRNDEKLFHIADISVGVGMETKKFADLWCSEGEWASQRVIETVLQSIHI